jgi:hypothetical protein
MKHLTSTNPGLEKLVQATPPGMAHWAGTGLSAANVFIIVISRWAVASASNAIAVSSSIA